MSLRTRVSAWPFAALFAAAGAVMIAYSTAAPGSGWPDRLALTVCGTDPNGAHALLLGALLLTLARGLGMRRRICWLLALALTVWSALTELEALVSRVPGEPWRLVPLLLVTVALLRAQAAFPVPLSRLRIRQAGVVAMAVGGTLLLLGSGLVAERGRFAVPVSTLDLGREFLAALAADSGPADFQGTAWLVPGLSLVGGLALIAVLLVLVAASPPPEPGSPLERSMARTLVAHPDSDTLAPFALRFDKSYVFAPDGRAAIGFRVLAGVMMAGGDPFGARAAWPAAIDAFLAEAEKHGWRPAVLGASAYTRQLWADRGLHAIGIGDEVVIDVAGFSLTGRKLRNVRQAVARTKRAGIETAVFREAELSRQPGNHGMLGPGSDSLGPGGDAEPAPDADGGEPAEQPGEPAQDGEGEAKAFGGPSLGAELRAIHRTWLDRTQPGQKHKSPTYRSGGSAGRGGRERGFAMNLDAMARGRHDEALLIVAFAADGYAVSFQRYLPAAADGPAPMLSLDVMPRDPLAPNGVNERLIVDIIEYAATHGYTAVSLNFAAFRKLFEARRNTADAPRLSKRRRWMFERAYRAIHLLDPLIQVESLYRFNAKFQPGWQPRSLLMRSWLDLPAFAAAAFGLEFALPYDRARERAEARPNPVADEPALGTAPDSQGVLSSDSLGGEVATVPDHANWSAVQRHSNRS
ncbi:MAG TPA: phosphatidylglycerol lysyltransferase domain-containing protein [Actinocrinis sp.]